MSITYRVYSRSDPLEMAESLIDDLDYVDTGLIVKVIQSLFLESALSPFGKEMFVFIDAIRTGKVSPFWTSEYQWGGKNRYDEFNERFIKWQKNRIPIDVKAIESGVKDEKERKTGME